MRRIIAASLVAGAFVAAGVACERRKEVTQSAAPTTLKERLCRGNEQVRELRDSGVRAEVIPGFNKSFYFTHKFSTPVDLEDLNRKNPEHWRAEMIAQAKRDMRPSLLADIKANPKRWYFRSGLRDALERAEQPEDWPPPGMPVYVTEQAGVIDCQTGIYTFSAIVAVPRQPLSEMPGADQLITEGMREPFERSLEPLNTKGTVTLTLPGLAIDALRRNVNPRKMAELRERYVQQLEYVDSETKLLIDWLSGSTVPVAPFGSAEYQLTSDMALVLSALTKAFAKVAEPNVAYEFIAVGRTDSRTLSRKQYVGRANVRLSPGVREEFGVFKADAVARATDVSERILTSNQELSVARGYAAAEALAEELTAHDVIGVRVLYGGDGQVNGTAVETDRRLEITLRKVPRDGR